MSVSKRFIEEISNIYLKEEGIDVAGDISVGVMGGEIGGAVIGNISSRTQLFAARTYYVIILKYLESRLKKADSVNKKSIQESIKRVKEKISWIDKNKKRIIKISTVSSSAFGAVGGGVAGAIIGKKYRK